LTRGPFNNLAAHVALLRTTTMNEPAALSTDDVSKSPSSPLAPAALRQLFFTPSAFFRSASLDHGPAWLIVAWISGMSSVIDRVDQRLLRAELKGVSSGTAAFEESWYAFWTLVLGMGFVWAGWNYWVGGWWYRMRLSWSGAWGTDPQKARLVHTFAGFVVYLPAVLYTMTQTIMYPNYRAAWASESVWGLLLMGFVLWSTVVSWRAVLAAFPVRPTRALWWFLILPIIFYCVLFGAVGVLLNMADGG
jgi:hypothetical protein